MKPLIFRNRDFGLLWSSQVFSQAGTRMYQIAILWWILEQLTEDQGLVIGTFMVCAAIPALVFVKLIGNILDSSRSKRILITSDISAAIIVGAISMLMFTNQLGVIAIFISSFLIACCDAFINPTLNKAVPELVAPEDVETAISFETSTQSAANFGGAVIGAILISQIGVFGVIIVNSLTYLISAICNVFVRYRYLNQPADDDGGQVEKESTPIWKQLAAQPLIRHILILFGFMNFFANPVLILMPVYIKNTLGESAATLANTEACLWLGLIGGAFLAGKIRVKNILVLGFFCVSVFGVSLAIPGLVIHKYAFMACLFIAGCFLGINNVKFVNFFQESVKPEIKGRFFALMQAIIGISFPVAYFFFGFLLDHLTPPQISLIQGSGLLLLAGYFLILKFSGIENKL